MYHQLAGGGGGYGDPRKRPMHLVWTDVRNGIVSLKAARDIYGVVVDEKTLALDADATASLRGEDST